MRAVFLLLVLANLVFFAYARVAREGSGVEGQIPLLQISPEKIRLLDAKGGPTAEKRRPPPTPPSSPLGEGGAAAPAACAEWGIFAGPDVARAEAALVRLELPQEKIVRTVVGAGGYWVYIPPLKTKADVDRKIGELRALGVTEFFVLQDVAQWRNAISLGIFRSDEAAQGFLAKLRARGVRSAVSERRENFLKQISFFVREPDEATVARLAELQKQEFPGSELKAGVCPAVTQQAKG